MRDPRNDELLGLVRHAARVRGEQALLAVGCTEVSASELARRVERLAAGLQARGLAGGERVAVLLERSVDEVVAVLATAVAGGIAVPMNQKLKDDQLRHLLADSRPWAVITSATRLLALRDPGALLLGQQVMAAGGEPVPGATVQLEHCDADPARLRAPDPAATAILLYTSGSTGLAKGVAQSHRNLTLGAEIVCDYLRLGPRDHILALLPVSFDYGLNQVLSALAAPCRITGADHLGSGELAELLRRLQPTGLAGVPSLFFEVRTGLETGTLSAAHGRSLRYVCNSGGPLRREDSSVLRRCWPQVEVYAMYGLTEAFRSAYLPPGDFDRVPESFGRAIEGVELLLVDPATGAVVEGAGQGELVHAGALIAAGYWQNPTATAARFRPDPRGLPATVVYSGDLVRRDEEGLLWFVGRMDAMLKVSGHRVSPAEVEAAFRDVDGVGEVHALGLPGAAEGHRIHVAVGGDADDAALLPRLWRRARGRLPSYMLPFAFHVMPTLPHNANGKVDGAALQRRIEACTGDD